MASDKALYVNGTNNTELVPAGVANQALARNSTNDGWQFAGAVLQTIFLPLTVNLTTATATILSQAITTVAGSKLRIRFNVSASNTNAGTNVNFQVFVDGVAISAANGGGKTAIRCVNAGVPSSAAYECVITGLAAGAHTVRVDWTVSGNTGQCRPTTAGVYEGAGLTLVESS